MATNDYMKDIIMNEITNLERSSNPLLRERGIQSRKASKKINCFVCMDSRQLWAWRRDVISTSMFSTHKYDLIHCNSCSNGRDIHTMSSPSGFKKNDTSNIDGRINHLITLYNSTIKPEIERVEQEKARKEKEERREAEQQQRERIKQQERNEANPKPLWGPGRYSKKYHHATSDTFESDIQKLANIVFESIQLIGGNYTAIAGVVKQIMLTLTSSIHEVDETDEVIGATEPDEFGNCQYAILKLSKQQKEEKKSFFGIFKKHSQEYTICATYLIMTPKNSKARTECNEFISGQMTKFINQMR